MADEPTMSVRDMMVVVSGHAIMKGLTLLEAVPHATEHPEALTEVVETVLGLAKLLECDIFQAAHVLDAVSSVRAGQLAKQARKAEGKAEAPHGGLVPLSKLTH